MSGARKRYQLNTTLYGRRTVSREQLYQLHREVTRAASLARRDDPVYMERYEAGQVYGGYAYRKWRELYSFKRDHEAATSAQEAATT